MTGVKGRVLLVSTGRELLDEMTPSIAGRGMEPLCVPTLKYAAERLSAGDCTAVVVDFSRVPPAERDSFLAVHEQFPKVHMFLLESIASFAPTHDAPLRRLPWPLPPGFADQLRTAIRPVLIFTDEVLAKSGGVLSALTQAGVRAVTLTPPGSLAELVRHQREMLISASSKPRHGKIWSLLGGGEEETEPSSEPMPGNVMTAGFSGTFEEACAEDAAIRAVTPEAVCYFVSGMPASNYALQALRNGMPVSLPRDQAGRIAGILAELIAGSDVVLKKRGVEHVLLLDNFKPAVEALAQALMGAGYEVTATMDGGEALRLCQKGTFHLAVIGTGINFSGHSSAEITQKMREQDPDLRIIFMVDQYPLRTALQGVSQVVELGLDDAILKPVEASRLIFSVEKALERRFLMMENTRLLQETRELNRRLSQINDFQKNFFATVAHDVKSPLTAIIGYAGVLNAKLKAMPAMQKYASNIETSAETLNVLISDLVDLAAIESGKLRVEIGDLNLLSVVQVVYERVKIAAQKRGLTLSVEAPPSLPPLAGDNARIGQVVQNLCTNAIQYTKEGGKVTIKAEVLPDRVVVSVIDTGIGISKEDLPRVWERFFQTEAAKGMRKAGFGLGLKIAREIVQRHGGEMGIESELGVGSRFFFHIPLKK
ncbi:MAG TPA: hybrid sensor histidine kinase/response regulator [Elusimicrobiales bacterium]|nr:hybrid sensor histidine kinase/response regulator [Elusimicrobiales bacterium]